MASHVNPSKGKEPHLRPPESTITASEFVLTLKIKSFHVSNTEMKRGGEEHKPCPRARQKLDPNASGFGIGNHPLLQMRIPSSSGEGKGEPSLVEQSA
ncbi:hypothetical protein AXF42_Ash004765 [Apostasia shenzhenica]|uniref:Uncharacterized protein n=1 Tax=Apostasia shenzhenica TaxID=1088818 RepID=A0A2I0BHK7_9ASPA|nr:hypothetical protein AXF42_Ash004765 [Apostasia shenzhenica]